MTLSQKDRFLGFSELVSLYANEVDTWSNGTSRPRLCLPVKRMQASWAIPVDQHLHCPPSDVVHMQLNMTGVR